MNGFKKYLNEINQDIAGAGGLDKALSAKRNAPPGEQAEQNWEAKSGKKIMLTKMRRLLIALLEEGKLDPKMTAAELPAFLEDETKKPN